MRWGHYLPGLERGNYALICDSPRGAPPPGTRQGHDLRGEVVKLCGLQGPGHQRSFVLVSELERETVDPEFFASHYSFHAHWLRPVGLLEAIAQHTR